MRFNQLVRKASKSTFWEKAKDVGMVVVADGFGVSQGIEEDSDETFQPVKVS